MDWHPSELSDVSIEKGQSHHRREFPPSSRLTFPRNENLGHRNMDRGDRTQSIRSHPIRKVYAGPVVDPVL